jgi:hypothetical protein
MKKKVKLGRRALLLGTGPVTAVTLLTSGNPANGRTGDNYAPIFFTASEWDFINSAVDRLIPSGGDGPGGVEAGVPEFIDRQLELPYGRGAYFYMSGRSNRTLRPNSATNCAIRRANSTGWGSWPLTARASRSGTKLSLNWTSPVRRHS